MHQAVEIDEIPALSSIKYSICSLVTDFSQYQEMLASLRQAGFSGDDCEFIYVNNATKNKYDAYQGLNKLITHARGTYIICCHQDILMNKDTRNDLEARIAQLDQLDPAWAVLGNAGGANHLSQLCVRITDPYGDNRKMGHFPFRAQSLDENFLLIKRAANLGFSHDLHGFHFYGTDICLLANTAGYSCYVIDFHLTHNSKGYMNQSFYDCQYALIKKFTYAFRSRFIRTTCTRLFISGVDWQSRLLNKPKMINIVKKLQRKAYWLGKK